MQCCGIIILNHKATQSTEWWASKIFLGDLLSNSGRFRSLSGILLYFYYPDSIPSYISSYWLLSLGFASLMQLNALLSETIVVFLIDLKQNLLPCQYALWRSSSYTCVLDLKKKKFCYEKLNSFVTYPLQSMFV